MIDSNATSLSQSAVWQTGTAVVQAACSIGLFGWYVLAAHMERARLRREKSDDFDSLVKLCRDLGIEAKDKTFAHLSAAANAMTEVSHSKADRLARLALWRSDMAIIYVCLNEVPHYEVRNPAFSTALTRLWLEVDARGVEAEQFVDSQQLVSFLGLKFDRIGVEVEAMARLLVQKPAERSTGRRMVGKAHRRGYSYTRDGFIQGHASLL
jgi:hypothetical protein